MNGIKQLALEFSESDAQVSQVTELISELSKKLMGENGPEYLRVLLNHGGASLDRDERRKRGMIEAPKQFPERRMQSAPEIFEKG